MSRRAIVLALVLALAAGAYGAFALGYRAAIAKATGSAAC